MATKHTPEEVVPLDPESQSVLSALKAGVQRNVYLRMVYALNRKGVSQTRLCQELGVSRTTIRKDLAEGRALVERDEVRAVDSSTSPAVKPALASASTSPREPLQGGRVTQTIQNTKVGNIVPQPDEWRLEDVDPDELAAMPPAELLSRLVRISPELGRGLFDFLRMANPDHSITVYTPGTESIHDQGQLAVELFEQELARKNGSANVVYNKLLTNVWLRGAFLAELVLDSSARYPVNIAVPDAGSVRFRVADDPDGGLRWEMVQRQDRDWVNIERETVKWAAFDPLPETPYGTPPVSPALFPAVFLITLLQDARRVVAQQGWPRYDISIDEEKLMGILPEDLRDDPSYVRELLNAAVNEVASAYDRLDPTSAYVHTASITVNDPKGAFADLPFLSDLVELLERMNVRALKTMPILFGMTDSTSEANANRQWEIHAASVKALQDMAQKSLSEIFTLSLQAQGIDAVAVFRFHELRSSEEKREADTRAIKLLNAETEIRLGFSTPAQAAVYATGRELPLGTDEEEIIELVRNGGTNPPQPEAPASEPDEENEFSGETGDGQELNTDNS